MKVNSYTKTNAGGVLARQMNIDNFKSMGSSPQRWANAMFDAIAFYEHDPDALERIEVAILDGCKEADRGKRKANIIYAAMEGLREEIGLDAGGCNPPQLDLQDPDEFTAWLVDKDICDDADTWVQLLRHLVGKTAASVEFFMPFGNDPLRFEVAITIG